MTAVLQIIENRKVVSKSTFQDISEDFSNGLLLSIEDTTGIRVTTSYEQFNSSKCSLICRYKDFNIIDKNTTKEQYLKDPLNIINRKWSQYLNGESTKKYTVLINLSYSE